MRSAGLSLNHKDRLEEETKRSSLLKLQLSQESVGNGLFFKPINDAGSGSAFSNKLDLDPAFHKIEVKSFEANYCFVRPVTKLCIKKSVTVFPQTDNSILYRSFLARFLLKFQGSTGSRSYIIAPDFHNINFTQHRLSR